MCLAKDEIYASGVDVVENIVEGDIVNVIFDIVHGYGEWAFRKENGCGARGYTIFGRREGFG